MLPGQARFCRRCGLRNNSRRSAGANRSFNWPLLVLVLIPLVGGLATIFFSAQRVPVAVMPAPFASHLSFPEPLRPFQFPVPFAPPHARSSWQNMMDSAHAISLPAADVEAAQLKSIAACWREPGDGEEILGEMRGVHIPTEGRYPIALRAGERLTTPTSFKTPVTFRIVLLTNLADMRIGYAFDQIIFNWEMRQSELRVDGGPGGGLQPKPGVGELPENQWVGIEFTVTPTEAILSVNGQEIDRLPGNYSAINQPFYIEAHNGPVNVRSVKFVQ